MTTKKNINAIIANEVMNSALHDLKADGYKVEDCYEKEMLYTVEDICEAIEYKDIEDLKANIAYLIGRAYVAGFDAGLFTD